MAVLAFLKGEPAQDPVRELLERGTAQLTAVGAGEVLDKLIRALDVEEDQAMLDLEQLGLGHGIDVTPTIGIAAGRLRARYYHRVRCPISMADCVAAETARAVDAALATSDPALLTTCHAEGIDVLVLPDSSGETWTPEAT